LTSKEVYQNRKTSKGKKIKKDTERTLKYLIIISVLKKGEPANEGRDERQSQGRQGAP